MPKTKRVRTIGAEDALARRIAYEREKADLTYERVSQKMADAGCPLLPSAIFRIEKGEPRRGISADELVAFSRVFGVPVQDMLQPPEIAVSLEAQALVKDFQTKRRAADAAEAPAAKAYDAIMRFAASSPEMLAAVEHLANDTFKKGTKTMAELVEEHFSDPFSDVVFLNPGKPVYD